MAFHIQQVLSPRHGLITVGLGFVRPSRYEGTLQQITAGKLPPLLC